MRYLIRCAAWLYPPRWRRRYGVEFDALLEDVRPGWRELLNVLKGALERSWRDWCHGECPTSMFPQGQ